MKRLIGIVSLLIVAVAVCGFALASPAKLVPRWYKVRLIATNSGGITGERTFNEAPEIVTALPYNLLNGAVDDQLAVNAQVDLVDTSTSPRTMHIWLTGAITKDYDVPEAPALVSALPHNVLAVALSKNQILMVDLVAAP